jgi:hypothetical protein
MPPPVLGLTEPLSYIFDLALWGMHGLGEDRRQVASLEQMRVAPPPPSVDGVEIIHASRRVRSREATQKELRQPFEELRLG